MTVGGDLIVRGKSHRNVKVESVRTSQMNSGERTSGT